MKLVHSIQKRQKLKTSRKLTVQQQKEVTRWVQSGEKSAADVARLFQVHPSTISRLMAKQGLVRVVEA